MDGLIIKRKWLKEVLCGNKSIELRSTITKKRGVIALIESGSGLIKGDTEITHSYGYVTREHFLNERGRHLLFKPPYKKTYAWVLNNTHFYSNPIPYTHPQGAVIWVKNVL